MFSLRNLLKYEDNDIIITKINLIEDYTNLIKNSRHILQAKLPTNIQIIYFDMYKKDQRSP